MNSFNRELMIISAYEELLGSIQFVCNELNIAPTILEWERATKGLLDKLQAQFAEHGHPDVVVSRGAVAGLIERYFRSIVVVRAEPDDVDMVEVLVRAREHGRKIGFLIYAQHAFAFKVDVLRSLLGLDVLQPYPFRSRKDIERQIVQGRRDGMDAMVGGGTLGLRKGKGMGYPVLFIETGKRSIRNAILQAIAIIEARRGEKRQLHSLETVIASVQEGIMTVRDGKVSLANQVLASMLHIPPATVPVRARDMAPVSELDPVLRGFIETDDRTEEILRIRSQDFLLKKVPLSSGEVMLIFRDVTEIQKQEQKIRRELHAKGLTARYRFEDILGSSPAFKSQIGKARTFAATNANILIHGESGTGKELFAQSIHNASARKNRPFVAVNCAAIPETLLESEMFGYEEGAFSGARRSGKAGLFELAHEGTIFLDEINSLPIELQGVLLRVIQEREIRRVGSQNIVSVDIRILSATNNTMEDLIARKAFRSDLYYRLNTLSLSLPPLSARREDVLPLAEHFLARFAAKYGARAVAFSEEDLRLIAAAPWTGNVRDLENVVHRFVVLNRDAEESRSVRYCMDSPVPAPIVAHRTEDASFAVRRGTLEEIETQVIARYLEESRWNKQEAADKLGVCRATLWRKMKRAPDMLPAPGWTRF